MVGIAFAAIVTLGAGLVIAGFGWGMAIELAKLMMAH